MADPSVVRSFDEPHIGLECSCGWSGTDDDIEDWAVEIDRDRAVRCCPDCDEPVPEWGVLAPIDGASKIARGPLKRAIERSPYEPE